MNFDRDDKMAHMRLRGAPPNIPNKFPVARFMPARSFYDMAKEPMNDRETELRPKGNIYTNPTNNKLTSFHVMNSVYDS